MTAETQKAIVSILYAKNRYLFFNKLESVDEATVKQNPFIVKELNYGTSFYELKEEFKELLPNLSIAEILQMMDSYDEISHIKTIKKWITFIGIVLLVSIIISIIIGLSSHIHD